MFSLYPLGLSPSNGREHIGIAPSIKKKKRRKLKSQFQFERKGISYGSREGSCCDMFARSFFFLNITNVVYYSEIYSNWVTSKFFLQTS
jgi:hypothetical protein